MPVRLKRDRGDQSHARYRSRYDRGNAVEA